MLNQTSEREASLSFASLVLFQNESGNNGVKTRLYAFGVRVRGSHTVSVATGHGLAETAIAETAIAET
jgi:hypothetical protein